MRRLRKKRYGALLAAFAVALQGCSPTRNFSFQEPKGKSYYQSFATQVEYPNVASKLNPESAATTAPLTTDNPADIPAWEMTLDEAIQLAMQRADVLRSLGASVVQAPAATRSRFDPAVTETNPQVGVEAALSAFDAQVTSALFWQKNNRPQNISGIFSSFQPRNLEQTTGNFQSQIQKRTATGATFAVRHNLVYDHNNSAARIFPSDYTGFFEAEWRQPLMQGSGIQYNRIAGPTNLVGQYNGILIARINTDVSLADFELSVITFVNDVETSYWELYYAYRNLQSQVAGRNNVLLTWQLVKEKQRIGAKGGEADAEAQARSQYYALDAQVKDALSGTNGLFAAEQRLRYLLGLPATDGRLIKPIQQPMEGLVVYDWDASLSDALTRRAEIRRQKWTIKRRELELIAARLNKRPRLDLLSQYRYRGLGDHLIGSKDSSNQFDNMYQSILTGDYQEWQAGAELSYPVGLRAASNAIANAQWNLTRENALLKEQELRVSHDLSNASRQIDRAYQLVLTNYNRQDADRLQTEVLRDRYRAGLTNIGFLLAAQQQLATSTSAYFRSLVDYQLALRDLHREKGSLLNYSQVGLTESEWAGPAYHDAYLKGQYFAPVTHRDSIVAPNPITAGAFDPSEPRMQVAPEMLDMSGGSPVGPAVGPGAAVPSSPAAPAAPAASAPKDPTT
ncbi:MAG: TolC family protein [Pirellulales bacterium]